ncbi:MAG: PKD domain-containing protein [Candidatus Bipolaricaulia bacterium]
MSKTMTTGCDFCRRASWRRLSALLILLSLVLVPAACNHTGPQVRILADAVDACTSQGVAAAIGVNQLVSFTSHLIGEGFLSEECLWEWQFGDGGSADGPEAWHRYRSPGISREWHVELTVTAPDGARGFDSLTLEMEEPLCGYAIQAVGTCSQVEGRLPLPPRPEIPQSCQLIRQEAGVETPWWEIAFGEPTYLLVELFTLPAEVSQVECCWSIYYRGEERDGAPELVGVAEWREVCQVNHEDTCNASVLLEVGPDVGVTEDGWYEVFARVTAPSSPARDYIGFLLHVGSDGNS